MVRSIKYSGFQMSKLRNFFESSTITTNMSLRGRQNWKCYNSINIFGATEVKD